MGIEALREGVGFRGRAIRLYNSWCSMLQSYESRDGFMKLSGVYEPNQCLEIIYNSGLTGEQYLFGVQQGNGVIQVCTVYVNPEIRLYTWEKGKVANEVTIRDGKLVSTLFVDANDRNS